MTAHEAYKFGFLRRCAEEGLGAADALARAGQVEREKRAAAEKQALVGHALGVLANGYGLGLAGAAGLGALGGFGLAKMRERPVDWQEIRKQELIAAYRSFADQVRRRDQLRPPAPRPGRIHMH